MFTLLELDLAALFTQIDISLLEKVIRTVGVYVGIIVLIRLAGKRLLAQMNNLDLVVILLLSNVVQNAIIGPDNSLVGGLVGAVVLVAFNAGIDRLAQVTPWLRRLVEGKPTQIIENGHPDEPALERLGITHDELDLAISRLGANDVSEVKRARLVPGGDIVIDMDPDLRPATVAELRAAVAEIKALVAPGVPEPPAGSQPEQ